MHHMKIVSLSGVVFCACLTGCAQVQDTDGSVSNISPTDEQLDTLESAPDDHPVFVMKLLRYRGKEGRKSYKEYSESAVSRIRELGGDVVFFGNAKPFTDFGGTPELFGFRTNPWDSVVFERYRSRKDLRKLGASKDYQAAAIHRQNSIEETVIYALNGSPAVDDDGSPILSDKRSSAETENVPAPPSPQAVYMLNLVRFKPDGGRNAYFHDYGDHVLPLIEKHGGKLIFGLEPEQLLVGTEQYDRVILVMYPSAEEFTNMIRSEDYQKVSHNRTNALEIGHLFAFSNARGELKRTDEQK